MPMIFSIDHSLSVYKSIEKVNDDSRTALLGIFVLISLTNSKIKIKSALIFVLQKFKNN